MALPTASTPGYALYQKRVACVCLVEWLPVLELMAIKRGIIKHNLDLLQLTGGLAASGGTHSKGGTFDVKQVGAPFVQLCREMGAPATWSRYNMPIGDNPNHHTHGVLNGCPHNSPARYQLAAQFARCNGLGFMGMGGKDPYPAVWPRRTWREGLAWARAELGLETPPAPKTVTVKSGQTLGKIAAALGVTLAALILANPQIKNPDVITPGQTITVPAKGATPAPQPTATPKPVVTPKPSTSKPAPKPLPPVVLTKWSAKYLHAGARNRTVVSYEKALAAYLGSSKARALGLTGSVVTDGYYGTATSAATKAAYRKLGVTPNATEPGPTLLRVLAGGGKATSNPAPKATVARVDASKLHKGVSSRHVAAYQRALRAYLGSAANRYNPAGATGLYGAQTEAMTRAVYRDLARKQPRGGWAPANEPGPGLLRVLGLR